MIITTDMLILAAAALAAAVFIGLVVSIGRGIAARRALRNLRAHMQEREDALRNAATASNHQLREELSSVQSENRGQFVALEQAQLQLLDKRRQLEAVASEQTDLRNHLATIQTELTQLRTQQFEREDRHKEQLGLLNEARDNLKKEFENLANRIFEEKGRRFTSTSKESLEAMLKPFREQITGFQTRIDVVHSESIKGNTALEKEIQKVLEVGLEMNSQATNLTTALKGDKKTAGNWGEAQLERTLELAGLQAGDHYEAQAAFRDDDGKRKLPDFIVKLPDSKNLVIDSKVSLVDYDRAIAADTDESRTEALNAHAQAVRNHIDDLSSKDYVNLPGIGSPDFVLMFMPIEPAYIEAMKHNKDLFNYGYQRGVVMVSHTTLMPILRTVANLWMVEQSNKEAKEISSRAGDIYNQVCLVADRLLKLGNSMRTANNYYNDTLTGLVGKQGLHGKIERFQQLSTKANKIMPTLEPIHDELETQRIETMEDRPDADPTPPILETVASAQGKVKTLNADKKK